MSCSPVFKAFYGLVMLSAAAGVGRCLLSMAASSLSPAAESAADKLLWALLRLCLLATEVSVLVFGMAAGHQLDSKKSIRSVLLVTCAASLLFFFIQIGLELGASDPTFKVQFFTDADA